MVHLQQIGRRSAASKRNASANAFAHLKMRLAIHTQDALNIDEHAVASQQYGKSDRKDQRGECFVRNLAEIANDHRVAERERVATARGEAAAQALLAHTITQTSLQFEFYKHWDGKLPSVVGSGTNILDVSSLLSPSDGRHKAR